MDVVNSPTLSEPDKIQLKISGRGVGREEERDEGGRLRLGTHGYTDFGQLKTVGILTIADGIAVQSTNFAPRLFLVAPNQFYKRRRKDRRCISPGEIGAG